jgi:hypothetical protein
MTETTRLNWDELEPGDAGKLLRQQLDSGGEAVSGFLDCHQWIPLAESSTFQTEGGHPDAHLRVAYAGTPPQLEFWEFISTSLPQNTRTVRGLRQLLKSNGMQPSQAGDIAASAGKLHIISLPAAADVLMKLDAVRSSAWLPEPLPTQRRTAASQRLDAVASALFNVSRSEAQTAIDYGFTYINFSVATKRSANLRGGDQLIYRTKGRVELVGFELNKRSKRYWVDFRIFPV